MWRNDLPKSGMVSFDHASSSVRECVRKSELTKDKKKRKGHCIPYKEGKQKRAGCRETSRRI